MAQPDSITPTIADVEGFAGEWAVDPKHSTVSFAVKHAMVTTVRGTFSDFSGTIRVASAEHADVEGEISVASLHTGVEARDNHLRSADFFDAEQFPSMSFVSTSVVRTGDTTFDLVGDLTVKSVTKSVVLNAEFQGAHLDQYGKLRVGIEAAGQISRKDFDLTWNVALETGGVLVSDTIKIHLDVSAVRIEAS